MAPGIMWAVLFHTPTNDLHLSKLAVGQDKDEWNHLERMSEAVSTYIGDLRETRAASLFLGRPSETTGVRHRVDGRHK
jgi:hypothetical protein